MFFIFYKFFTTAQMGTGYTGLYIHFNKGLSKYESRGGGDGGNGGDGRAVFIFIKVCFF